jgi:two-component system sensor kinase FixL
VSLRIRPERGHLSFGLIYLSLGSSATGGNPSAVKIEGMGTATEVTLRISPLERIVGFCLQAGRSPVLAITAGMIAVIAFADWAIRLNISLGVLYLVPMMFAATVLNPPAICALAGICAILRLLFDFSPSSREETVLRFLFAAFAYTASGLFMTALIRNRQLIAAHLGEMQKEKTMRQEAEEQLRVLVQSSPAGIVTLDETGVVLAANGAANTLFAMAGGTQLEGRPVRDYLPVLADALQLDIGTEPFHTAAQCQGRRENGEIFLANTWFSTYRTEDGIRLAAIIVDSSDEMREREEEGLRQLSAHSRITAAAVSHEVRNLCGAISLVFSNLADRHGFQEDPGFQGLGSLVKGLETITSLDLSARAQETIREISLRDVLNNLRIIVEPSWKDMGGRVIWNLPHQLPIIIADPNGLLQAFLNLTHNSRRAVEECSVRELTISAIEERQRATVRFKDTGPGVPAAQPLFQPFQQGAVSTGMGLYISRAILRSYGGELRHEPGGDGACFAVDLQVVPPEVAP